MGPADSRSAVLVPKSSRCPSAYRLTRVRDGTGRESRKRPSEKSQPAEVRVSSAFSSFSRPGVSSPRSAPAQSGRPRWSGGLLMLTNREITRRRMTLSLDYRPEPARAARCLRTPDHRTPRPRSRFSPAARACTSRSTKSSRASWSWKSRRVQFLSAAPQHAGHRLPRPSRRTLESRAFSQVEPSSAGSLWTHAWSSSLLSSGYGSGMWRAMNGRSRPPSR